METKCIILLWPSILVDDTYVQTIQTPNIGVVYSGMGPDFRVLVQKSRKHAEQYYCLYKEPIHVTQLVRETATAVQEFAQSGGVRPFSVSFLVAGYDDKGLQQYQVNLSSSYFSWEASVMVRNASNAKTFLQKSYNEEMELDDIGIVTIINNGVTILKMVEVVELQDREVGDGTSVIIIVAELLKRVNYMVRNKIHQTPIISGHKLAVREKYKYVDEKLAVKVEKPGKDSLINSAKTSMSSKFIEGDSNFIANLVEGVALDNPLDSAVLSRLIQFLAIDKLKKMTPRAIAESLFEEEIANLKDMFKIIDMDSCEYITFEDLKVGLKRFGAIFNESEMYDLMKAANVDNGVTIDYREVYVDVLVVRERTENLMVHASNKKIDSDVSLEVIVMRTLDFSGTNLVNLSNEAPILAGGHGKTAISFTEIVDSVDWIAAGMEGIFMSNGKSKSLVACHEAEVTNGAAGDLQLFTGLTMQLVATFGLSDIGPWSLMGSAQSGDVNMRMMARNQCPKNLLKISMLNLSSSREDMTLLRGEYCYEPSYLDYGLHCFSLD